MSTMDQVRSAENRIRDVLDAMKRDVVCQKHYIDDLNRATDEYARAVHELELKPRRSKWAFQWRTERTGTN
jgi:hypothetical protein